ncbi:MAG: hypothetical protein WCQ50_20340, partial [Spirochaetota bacterium]
FLSEMRKVSKRPRAEMYGPLRIEGSTFTDFYPWHSYYSTQKVGQANSDFALWQIHGFWFYKRSLVIGSMDYASAIHRLREWIYETSNRKRTIGTENWIGAKSWVDIFLHNDLVIIGLSLGSQETSLRWLLIEREKYFRNFPERRRKTVYCINGERDEAWDAGKAFYFQSICVDCRVIKSGKELYEIWE